VREGEGKEREEMREHEMKGKVKERLRRGGRDREKEGGEEGRQERMEGRRSRGGEKRSVAPPASVPISAST